MSWTTSLTDLRDLLSDGPTDRLRYRKRMIGETNGTNLRFKSFEYRRITNFKTNTNPSLGVFVNGTIVSTANITSDSLEIGEVVLVTAPTNNQRVEGSYYIQWFLDAELNVFLKNATEWLGLGEDVTKVPAGLQPAALYYAAQEAYHKLAVRWAERLSEVYKMEDAPKTERNAVESFRNLAADAKKKSESLRAGFYTRQDQPLAPLYGFALGQVRPVVPRR